jgi:hypothetical protein
MEKNLGEVHAWREMMNVRFGGDTIDIVKNIFTIFWSLEFRNIVRTMLEEIYF